MKFWSIFCDEKRFPGLWQIWYTEQDVAVGWWPPLWKIDGRSKDRNWVRARNVITKIRVGDGIVVRLHGNRIGRVGEVTALAIDDQSWSPTVSRTSKSRPKGEQGRRIHVRWDLSYGPLTPDRVVKLPPSARLKSPNQVLTTACSLHPGQFRRIVAAAKDDANWEGLLPGFSEEKAISDYIASFPQRLESGLRPDPNSKVREKTYDNRTRSDVRLIDEQGTPVVVECKQTVPTLNHLKQVRGYMKKVQEEHGGRVRGILVHGGSRKLPEDVKRESKRRPIVDLIQYSVAVGFAPCG